MDRGNAKPRKDCRELAAADARDLCPEFLAYAPIFVPSGVEIETDIFLTDKFSHISALLYDEGDWVNPVDPPGHDFKMMHNPRAEAPLPDGWFRHGHEYWFRDELRLESKNHSASDA